MCAVNDLLSIFQRREGGGKKPAVEVDEKTRREQLAGTRNKPKGKVFDAFANHQQKG